MITAATSSPSGGSLTVASAVWTDVLLRSPSVAAARSSDLWASTLPWLVGLVVIAVVGWFSLYLIRRMLQRENTANDGFTLDALRQLHREGKLTDEEFARAKNSMLEGARAAAARHRARSAEQSQPSARATTDTDGDDRDGRQRG